MKSTTLNRFVFATIFAGMAACGQSDALSIRQQQMSDVDLLALLNDLRPSHSELAAMVSSSRSTPELAAAPTLAPASSAPYLAALELTPYLIDDQDNQILLVAGMPATAVADGTVAVIPYTIEYEDDVTAFNGSLQLRFVWDGQANLFYKATPAYVVAEFIEGDYIYVEGVVYNQLLDTLVGGEHDNGQMPGATVYAITPDQQSYSTSTNPDGTYRLGPLPTNVSFQIFAGADGFYVSPATLTVNYAEGVVITGLDFDLFPVFSELVETSSIYGRVVDLDNQPVYAGFARVLNAATGEEVAEAGTVLTNANGEYILTNVPVVEDVEYVVEVRAGVKSVQSSAVTFVVGNPQPEMRDLTIANHAPEIVCEANGSSGSEIVVSLASDGEVLLSASGQDVDGDTIIFQWLQPSLGAVLTMPLASGQSQAMFQAGGSSGMTTVYVAATDGSSQPQMCKFDLYIGNF